MDRAYRFLAVRPRSEFELRKKLAGVKKREREGALIEEAVDKLKKQKLIDDKEFVRWWVEQRIKFKPKGLRAIRQELKMKGVSEELIGLAALGDLISESGESEAEMAKKLVCGFQLKWQNSSKREWREKAMAYLKRRGFGWETIKEAVDVWEK